MSEVVLNYEELDINQCPGDRQLNAFSSTSLCDSTSECLPKTDYGLRPGGYECECISGFTYPFNIQGPYRGQELSDSNSNIYPLCRKSEGLIQYPNWVNKNAIENPMPNIASSSFENNFDLNIRKRDLDPLLKLPVFNEKNKVKRKKRFIDMRNNFEKLRDSIYGNQDDLNRRCSIMSFQDILRLNDDDERFILNLRFLNLFFTILKELSKL